MDRIAGTRLTEEQRAELSRKVAEANAQSRKNAQFKSGR